MTPRKKVDANRFYSQYHGHPVNDLTIILEALRENTDGLIFTAGDSSLDNKYWFVDSKPAVGVYADILNPPISNADVTYWLNYLLEERQRNQQQQQQQPQSMSAAAVPKIAAINAAVEATTLNERTFCLRSQDKFIRDNIQPNDILVVSVGGNDVAMCPMPCTILSILSLVYLPESCLEKGCIIGTVPCNEYCCGCGPSAICSCLGACPPCFGYMIHLFGIRVQKYIEKLIQKNKPKKVLICMIYYPDEHNVPSWANPALACLGYNYNPSKLQTLIRRAFVEATSKRQIDGTEIIPVPLFNVLDGKNSHDYIARVEPSSLGGRKMAEYILDIIDKSPQNSYGSLQKQATIEPVQQTYMADRS